MIRLTLALAVAAGSLALAGCSKSGEGEPSAPAAGAGKFSPDEIADSRRRLEQSLTKDAEKGRPNLAASLAPLGSLALVPQWGLPETAADALARIGPTAVPALMKALQDADPKVRTRAAQAFARMGPEASDAVPALTRALADKDPDVRRYAARALGQIGPAAETAIPALVMAMSEPEEDEKFKVPTVVVPMPGDRGAVPGPSPSDQR